MTRSVTASIMLFSSFSKIRANVVGQRKSEAVVSEAKSRSSTLRKPKIGSWLKFGGGSINATFTPEYLLGLKIPKTVCIRTFQVRLWLARVTNALLFPPFLTFKTCLYRS